MRATCRTPRRCPGHHPEPDYVPIDEEHPLRPHSSYSLSKVLGEEMARQFARWSQSPSSASASPRSASRRSKIVPRLLARSPHSSEWNLWGYVDARDVAQACRLSLTAPLTEADVFHDRGPGYCDDRQTLS